MLLLSVLLQNSGKWRNATEVWSVVLLSLGADDEDNLISFFRVFSITCHVAWLTLVLAVAECSAFLHVLSQCFKLIIQKMKKVHLRIMTIIWYKSFADITNEVYGTQAAWWYCSCSFQHFPPSVTLILSSATRKQSRKSFKLYSSILKFNSLPKNPYTSLSNRRGCRKNNVHPASRGVWKQMTVRLSCHLQTSRISMCIEGINT